MWRELGHALCPTQPPKLPTEERLGKVPEAPEILTATVVSRTMVLQQGPFCRPGDIRERLDTFSVFIVEGVGDAIVSSGWKSGMLPACCNP